MIPLSRKAKTLRTAEARAVLSCSPGTTGKILSQDLPKKDPLGVARTAGIMAAKKTPELLPYCHPIPLDGVELHFKLEEGRITALSRVEAVWKTGVEMEALTAVSVAALTLYDMLKPIDDSMEIISVKLLSKKGGKSDFKMKLAPGLLAGVLTVSDGVYQGKREDLSGRRIEKRLQEWGIQPIYALVPDEKSQISAKLEEWCGMNFSLILTTGGTGLSPRDVTVEAMRELLDREMPGIAEAARAHGQDRTPYSMMSRGLAGQRGKTLLAALPGSPRAVEEWLDALLPGIFHGIPMMKGEGH